MRQREFPSTKEAIMEDGIINGVGRMDMVVKRGWRWWDAFFGKRSQRRAASCLHTLDDRRLNDIGVTRGQTERAVQGVDVRDKFAGRTF